MELGQLVQKEHSVVGQGDLSRPGSGASACHAHGGDSMVRGPEWPPGEQGLVFAGQTHHRVDLGALQSLPAGHVGQDGGQAAGQHGLARARRANHQYDMLHPHGLEKVSNIKGFTPM